MLRIDQLTEISRLPEIESGWRKILSPDELSPFLSPSWVHCCLESYGQDKQVMILLASEHGRISGIAPLWIERTRIRGVPLRRITFIRGPDTPFADFIVHPERRDAIIRGFLSHMYRCCKGWDIAELGPIPEGSDNLSAAAEALHENQNWWLVKIGSLLPYVHLEGGWNTFLKTKSAKFRKTSRNVANRIGRLGEVSVERHLADPQGAVVRDLIQVSERSWKQRAGVSIASRPDFTQFFRSLTQRADAEGWLLVWLLKKAGQPIATEFNLHHAGRVWALRADYDESHREYSPGSYLQLEILKELFCESYVEYNTGPGMDDYKLRTTDAVRENKSIWLFRKNLRGSIAWAIERVLVPLVRKLRQI